MKIKFTSFLKVAATLVLIVSVILAMAIYYLLNTQSGLTWMLKQASPMVSVKSVSGSALNAELGGLLIDTDAVSIAAESAQLDWDLMSLLSRSLTINSLDLSKLEVILKQTDQKPSTPFQTWQGLHLPININLKKARVAKFSLIQKDSELLALSQIDLQARIKNDLLDVEQLAIKDAENSIALQGSVDLSAAPNGKVDVQHYTSWALPSYEVTSQGSINGEWQKLVIQQTVSSPVRVELDAILNNALTELLSWKAKIISTQLPSQQLMNEVVSIGDGVFTTEGQFAPGQGLSSLQANLVGGFSLGSERFANWKIDASTDYQQGSLLIDSLSVSQIDTKQPKNLKVNGVVDNVFAFLDAGHGKGKMDVSGEWNQLQWPVIADAPQVLADGQFQLKGSSSDYQLTANASGQLQGRPLQANVNADLDSESVVINKLDLTAGDTRATLDGKIDTAYDVSWEFNSANIGDVLAGTSGNLISSGRLFGSRSSPSVSFQADSQGLSVSNFSTAALQLKVDAPLGNWQDNLNVVLNTGNISSKTGTFAESVNVRLAGTGLQHKLTVNATLDAGAPGVENNSSEISIQASGGFDGQQWLGQLSELTVNNPLLKTWSLNKVADLDVASGSINVSETCLVNNDQALCFSATQNTQELNIDGLIKSLNLANMDQFIHAYDLSTAGIVNGEFSYVKAAVKEHAKVSLRLDCSAANVSWPDPGSQSGERDSLSIESFNVSVSQDEVLDLTAYLKLNNGDLIDAKINIAEGFESRQFQSAQLTGQINGDFQKLENLPPSLLSNIALNGSFTSNVTLSGSLTDPSINLLAEVENASAGIAVLDLQLEQINLTARSNDSSVINLEGSLMSGEGQLDIHGTFDFSELAEPVIEIQLNGQDIQLANTPELNIVGDVDFATNINRQLIDVQGSIVIDKAELDFKLPDNAILASSDVVLAGQDEVAKGAGQQLDLTIDLGQETHIQSKGLDANLTGKLRVFQTPKSIVRGEGEINVINGMYAAYGEELEIERGRLIFSRGSIDDPNLELRAQKTVDSIIAGVSVVGRASSPELNLYSTPSMSDQDILSVLVFDKPLGDLDSQDGLTLLRIVNSLRGDGEASRISKTTDNIRDSLGLTDLSLELGNDAPSIEAGKQLSSKFYIGYGYGLLDAAQSLILKYQLSDAWSVKADVGADSGADIRYQIER